MQTISSGPSSPWLVRHTSYPGGPVRRDHPVVLREPPHRVDKHVVRHLLGRTPRPAGSRGSPGPGRRTRAPAVRRAVRRRPGGSADRAPPGSTDRSGGGPCRRPGPRRRRCRRGGRSRCIVHAFETSRSVTGKQGPWRSCEKVPDRANEKIAQRRAKRLRKECGERAGPAFTEPTSRGATASYDSVTVPQGTVPRVGAGQDHPLGWYEPCGLTLGSDLAFPTPRNARAADHNDVSRRRFGRYSASSPGNGRRASCEGRSSEGSQEPRVPGGDHPGRRARVRSATGTRF